MTEMSRIVRTITAVLFPLALIYGLYIIAHGHLTPGGGFQGGAVVASSLALVLVAFGSKWVMNKIKERQLSVFESLGAFCFILLAFLGLGFGTAFFNNFLVGNPILFGTVPEFGIAPANINTGGILPLMNFAVGLKVLAGLFVIVLVLAYASSVKGGKQ